jgi:4-amino-4-deoxy-L-arabinose transferase-like glycosyltransferase
VIIGIVLFAFSITELPAKLNHFESWIDYWLPVLDKGWNEIRNAFFTRFGDNDTNASVSSPIWVVISAVSGFVFDDPVLIHRVPSAATAIISAVVMADLVRRFYRADLAFLAGLLSLTSQNLLLFGSMAGYIVPTVALFVVTVWCLLNIMIEKRRGYWIGLGLCLLFSPFMYATIRYMIFIPLASLLLGVVFSAEFRRSNIKHFAALCAVLLVALIPFSKEGFYPMLLNYFNARGEQYLVTHSVISGAAETEGRGLMERMRGVLIKQAPEKLSILYVKYSEGERFFNFYFERHRHNIQGFVFFAFLCGMARLIYLSVYSIRYLVILSWSIWTWIPLLLTTSVSVNRMLIGLPADLFIMLLGFALPFDGLKRVLPKAIHPIVYSLMCLGVFYIAGLSAYWYFVYNAVHARW